MILIRYPYHKLNVHCFQGVIGTYVVGMLFRVGIPVFLNYAQISYSQRVCYCFVTSVPENDMGLILQAFTLVQLALPIIPIIGGVILTLVRFSSLRSYNHQMASSRRSRMFDRDHSHDGYNVQRVYGLQHPSLH